MKPTKNIGILIERLGRIMQNETHTAGLKPTQWEALRFLARANRFSRNPTAVTAYLGMTKGTVSQTLSVLAQKGLIRKITSKKDRRNLTLDLTAKGKACLKNDPVARVDQGSEVLGRTEREILSTQLNAILQSLLKRRGGRAFGVCQTCRYFEHDVSDGNPHRCALLKLSLTQSDSNKICIEQEAA